jgi:hypothetical protein
LVKRWPIDIFIDV